MLYVFDTVDNGVTHTEVAGSKVDLCAKCIFTFGEFTVLHAFKEIKALFDRTITERRNCGIFSITCIFGI